MLPKPYYETELGKLYHGQSLDVLKRLPGESVQCCVTSPPYWGLRNYDIDSVIWDGSHGCKHVWGNETGLKRSARDDQYYNGRPYSMSANKRREPQQGRFCQLCGAWWGSLGLEPTPELYINHIVQCFQKVWRVLKNDGCLWLNLGDSYAASRSYQVSDNKNPAAGPSIHLGRSTPPKGYKQKDLIGMPWQVAFALRSDGWYLRSAIPWVKRNPMPESVKDRPTDALEYVFLLSKSRKYFYDKDAIKLQASPDSHRRYARGRSNDHKYSDGGPGNQTIAKSFSHMRKPGVTPKSAPAGSGIKANESFHERVCDIVEKRNFRNTDLFYQSINPSHGMIFCNDEMVGIDVNPKGYKGAHYATFPPKLIDPFILAGCPEDEIVIDPFFGSGVTGKECERLKRRWIGIEISEQYCKLAVERIEAERKQLKWC